MEYIDTDTPQCQNCLKDKVTCNGAYPCHRCEKLGVSDHCSLKEEKRGTKRALDENEIKQLFELNFKKKKETPEQPQNQITYYQLEDTIPEDKKPDYTVHHKILEDAIDFSVFRARILEEDTISTLQRTQSPQINVQRSQPTVQSHIHSSSEDELPNIDFNELGDESITAHNKYLTEENKKLIEKVSKLEKENAQLKRFQFKNIPNLLNPSYGVILSGSYGKIAGWNEIIKKKLGYDHHILRDRKVDLHWVDITSEKDREPSFIKMTECLKMKKDFYEVEEMTLINHLNPKFSVKVKAKYYLNYFHGDPYPFSSICFLEFK